MNELFLRNEMLWGREAQERLARAHVILFGLGGVGSYTAECLARSGIGELTIVDNDAVSPSNRNRQLEALASTVGQEKTAAVAARLRDIHPGLRLHPSCATYDAAHRDRFFPEGCRYDYIADAIDLVSCKLDLAETARQLGIPLIMTLGTGNKLDPSLLRLADISETYGCPLARVMRKQGVLQGFRVVGSGSKLGRDYPVVAYRFGGAVELEKLLDYIPASNGERQHLQALMKKSRLSLAEAREKYPDWYERRIVKKERRGRWTVKRDLYDWWLRRIADEIKVGHRFYGIMTLAIYAKKCDIDEDELREDAFGLLQRYDDMSVEDIIRFTKDDIV